MLNEIIASDNPVVFILAPVGSRNDFISELSNKFDKTFGLMIILKIYHICTLL